MGLNPLYAFMIGDNIEWDGEEYRVILSELNGDFADFELVDVSGGTIKIKGTKNSFPMVKWTGVNKF